MSCANSANRPSGAAKSNSPEPDRPHRSDRSPARPAARTCTAPHDWPARQIQPFLDYLQVEGGLSRNTLLAYRRDLIDFAEFCHDNGLADPNALVPALVQRFSQYLGRRRLAANSIARHLAAVRMFLRFQMLTGLLQRDVFSVVESPKMWQRLPRVLSTGQTDQLLQAVDPQSPLHQRDRAILELLYACGIRASEAADLLLDSVNFQVGFLRCIGKGSKERIIPVHETALAVVRAYLDQCRPALVRGKPVGRLFLSRTGKPLTRLDIWRIVRKAARRAGLGGKVTPHMLRHSFGSHLLQGGADLRVVQEMLGHADVATTQIYTHVDNQFLRSVHKKFHPRG